MKFISGLNQDSMFVEVSHVSGRGVKMGGLVVVISVQFVYHFGMHTIDAS